MGSTLFEVVPGRWRGEIGGGGTLHFGQAVQSKTTSRSVELIYVILPALLTAPGSGLDWPSV